MEKRKLLKEVKKCYENGGNIIQYLKEIDNRTENTIEDILISYDFQAGTYYEKYKERTKKQELVYDSIAEILSRYVNIVGEKCVVMEAGIGEATTMGPVLKRIGENKVGEIYGFDISWSRIMYAKKFLTELYDGKCPENIKLFTGDLMNMPVKESSVDILYTVHAAEPNGGKEKEVLKELYLVAGRYLILFEPAYELADEKARERMKKHGYITNMYETAIELGYNVKSYELLDNCINPDNPTGVMIIEKKKDTDLKDNNDGSRKVFACPVSKEDVCICENVMYCEDSMLIYPIIQDIPCLLEDNAIIATKFKEVYV